MAFSFNLAHLVRRVRVEFGADFFEGHFLTAYAEEHFEDFAFTVVELLEGALYFFDRDSWVSVASAIGESSFASTSRRLLSSPSTKGASTEIWRPETLRCIGDFVDRHVELFSEFFRRRTAFVFLFEFRECLADFVERTYLVERQAHYAACSARAWRMD